MARRSNRGEPSEDQVQAEIEEPGNPPDDSGEENGESTSGVRHSIRGTGKAVTNTLKKVYDGDRANENVKPPKARGRRKIESKAEFVDAIADPLNSVRIKCVYPDSFGEFDLRGQTIKMHTPTSHEKITERITSSFGGGEYKAYVYPDGDDDTILAANLFSIEGDPVVPSIESNQEPLIDLPTPESILSDASAQAQAELEKKKVEFEKLKIDLEMKALKEGETRRGDPAIDVKTLIESNTKMILEFQERLQRNTMETMASMNRANTDQHMIDELKQEIQQLKMGGGKRSDDSAILNMLMNQNNSLLTQVSQRPRGGDRSVLGDAMEVLEMIRTVKSEVTGNGILHDDPNSLSAIVASLTPAISKITDAMKDRGYSQQQVEDVARKTTIDVIRKVITPEMLAEAMMKALPQTPPVAQISAPQPQLVAPVVQNPVPQPVVPAPTIEEKEKMPTDTEVIQAVVKTILSELATCPADPEWVNLAYENLSDETLAQINNVSMVGNPDIHKDLEAIVHPKCPDELYRSMVAALENDKRKQEWIGFSIMALQHEYRESVLKGR